MEYTERNVPDNFDTSQEKVGVGLVLDAHRTNRNILRSTKTIRVGTQVAQNTPLRCSK